MNQHWYWNEFAQGGTDYGSAAEVERYDRRMALIRDVVAENRAILKTLSLAPGAAVVEIGCGTAAFSIAAALAGAHVVALDISPVMLAYAESKARAAGAQGINFRRGGFLTYEHAGPPVDAIVTSLALHHLPDFWKSVALSRVAAILKPGGRLFLMDVVYSFEVAPDEFFPAFFAGMPEAMRPNTMRHVGQEFSTSDWIMRGLLDRAGFTIENAAYENGWLARYLCRKAA